MRTLRFNLAALLLLTIPSLLLAAPPHTGIRGQAQLYHSGFAVEAGRGLWIGVGGFVVPVVASFTVLSAHSGHEVGYITTDEDGGFLVKLPPGRYIIVPDTLIEPIACSVPADPFQIIVESRRFTKVDINYFRDLLCSIPVTPVP